MAKVGAGVLIAQAIALVFSPVISRLYTPDEIGIFSFFSSGVVICTLFVTLTIEYAIVLAEKKQESSDLTKLSLILSTALSAILFGLSFSVADSLSEIFNVPAVVLILIPLGALSHAWFNTGYQLHIHRKEFKNMSVAKVAQTGSMVSIQSLLPFVGFSYSGLILGYIAGRVISVSVLFRNFSDVLLNKISNKWRLLLKKYADHPAYVLPSSLLSSLSQQLPMLAIAPIFGSVMLGFYGLAFRVLMLPITLISSSTGSVFFKSFSESYNKQKPLTPKLLKTWGTLFAIGFLPFLILFLFSVPIFEFIFGDQWTQSGTLSGIMSPMLFLMFIFTATSKSLLVMDKKRWMPVNSFFGLLAKGVALYVGFLNDDFYLFIWMLTIAQSIVYLFQIIQIYYFASQHDAQLKSHA